MTTTSQQLDDAAIASLSLFLIQSSVILFGAALVLSHCLSGYPKNALGHRSHGVVGYDAVLGCIPPHFRYLFHLSYSVAGTGLFLWKILPKGAIAEAGGLEVCILPPIMCYVVFYLSVIVQRSKDVSKPGPPRTQPITRHPSWGDGNNNNKVHTLPEDARKQWRCVVAKESHNVSEAINSSNNHKGNLKMTGDPCGRQIWTTTTTTNSADSKQKQKHGPDSMIIDEQLVLKLAAGGDEADGYGFNPSKNPNR
jgi:hypothetical protein